jgi:chromosome segregation ATPase
MPQRNPLPDYVDNVLSAARAVSLIVPDMEAAPAQAKRLQKELASLETQITTARQSLAKEKSEFDTWRRQAVDEGAEDQTQRDLEQRDHEKEVATLRATAISLQNRAQAEGLKLAEIVKECRRLERQLMHPHAVPLG